MTNPADQAPQSENESQHNLDPIVQSVVDAYSEVQTHNTRYTGIAGAFKSILLGMVQDPENPDKSLRESGQSNIQEGEMNAALVDMINENAFTGIGVKIQPTGQFIEGQTSPELRPHLIPHAGGMYAEFLSRVEDSQVEQLGKLPTDIDTSVATEMRAILASDELSDSGKDAVVMARLQDFAPSIDHYDRLGIPSKTAEYVKRYYEGTLSAYIEAEDLGVTSDVPQYWHLDGFGKDWKTAIPFVTKLENDESTAGLAAELKEKLVSDIDQALLDLETDERKAYAKPEARGLVEIKKMLSGEEYDAELVMKRWMTEKPDRLE